MRIAKQIVYIFYHLFVTKIKWLPTIRLLIFVTALKS